MKIFFYTKSPSQVLFPKRVLYSRLGVSSEDWIYPISQTTEGWEIRKTNIAEEDEPEDRRVVTIAAPLPADEHLVYKEWTELLHDIWAPQMAELKGAMSGSVHSLEESLSGRDAASILQELLKSSHEVARLVHRGKTDDQAQELQLKILADTVQAAGEHKQLELGREEQAFERTWQQMSAFKDILRQGLEKVEEYHEEITSDDDDDDDLELSMIMLNSQKERLETLLCELTRLQLSLLQEQMHSLEDHISFSDDNKKESLFVTAFSQQPVASLLPKQVLQCEKGMSILLKSVRAAHRSRREQMDLALGRSGRHQGQMRGALETVVSHAREKGTAHANADLLRRRIGTEFEKLKSLCLQTHKRVNAVLDEIKKRQPVIIAPSELQKDVHTRLTEALEKASNILSRTVLLGRMKADCNPNERALVDSITSMQRLSFLLNEIPNEGLERFGKMLRAELIRLHKIIYDNYLKRKEDYDSGRLRIIRDVKVRNRQETRVHKKTDWLSLEWESLSPADYQEHLRRCILMDLTSEVTKPYRDLKRNLKEQLQSGDPVTMSSVDPEDERRFLEDFGTMNEVFFDLLLDILSYFLPAQQRTLVSQVKSALKRGDYAKLNLYEQSFELRYDEEEYVAGSRDELPDQNYFLINGMPAVLYEARPKGKQAGKRGKSLLSVLHTLSEEMLNGTYNSEDVDAELKIVERKG
jgi:hypothetical protein